MVKNVERSLQLTAEQLVEANIALSKFGSKSDLAADLKMSRTTIGNFFAGRTVQRKEFHRICKKLKFNWQPIPQKKAVGNIDEIVQSIRNAIRPTILEKCGKIRVLDMEQPIGLDDIYTNVNILEKITGCRQLDLIKMMQKVSPEDVERFSLGAVEEERVPGLEAAERHNKLMILGKPGAGKTTFLKHLAVQCIGGNFQPHRIPIFVTLKEFAETERQPNLADYIHQSIATCIAMTKDLASLKDVFNAGQALILLDGLDEVSETDTSRVLGQIKKFSETHHNNQYVMTCRIAAREYTFEQFTEVEVSDFDEEQIADFSNKWFCAKQDAVKGKTFLQKLKANPSIKELATRPLLLTLLCLGFEESGNFPANRSELYEAGIDVLLRKWDAKRNIERDQVYKKLSLKRKEDMLSQIAWNTFKTGNYFFKQKDLERQIREFLENVTGASTDEQELALDSAAVLKLIESQHGLFVERARGIYSFSHLTFHEYFAAREVKEKFLFQQLASHIAEYRWQEVILLTTEMLPNADDFVCHLKQTTDALLGNEQELQKMLLWANDKTRRIKDLYKPQALRAYYLWLALPFTLDLSRTRTINLPLDLSLAHILSYQLAKNLDLDNGQSHDNNLVAPLENDTVFALEFKCGTTFFCHLNLNHTRTLDLVLDHALTIILARALILGQTRTFDYALIPTLAPKLSLPVDFQLQLQNILIKFLNPDKVDQEIQLDWWETNCKTYAEKLRTFMIYHRDIGHNWYFTSEQLEKLERYLSTNLLLLRCLDSDCVITRSIREEIEDTLLLPISEIETRTSTRRE
jgi:predicted NACHT family NTPase